MFPPPEDTGGRIWPDPRHARARGLGFSDIVVYPTQRMRLGRAMGIVQGGPDWPWFRFQLAARHCRGPVPVPCDLRPDTARAPEEEAEAGLWCGPISFHFGHMVADFGMRIAAARLLDARTPLVFSIWDAPGVAPAPFFWEIVDHFGIARERIRLVARPTRFAQLRVLPQSERLCGGGPSRRHLALMDGLTGPAPEPDLGVVHVSRARQSQGRIAGEGVLDAALAAAGVRVIHPESMPLAEQLAVYRRARHIVFSEGSALHGLQLLGHVPAAVTVLVRRPGRRLAAASLKPRVRSLAYLDAVRSLVHGLRPDGTPHLPTGISVLDEARCLAGFARLGIDLAAQWDSAAFARAAEADVMDWVVRRGAEPRHPREPERIARCLRSLARPDGRLGPEPACPVQAAFSAATM